MLTASHLCLADEPFLLDWTSVENTEVQGTRSQLLAPHAKPADGQTGRKRSFAEMSGLIGADKDSQYEIGTSSNKRPSLELELPFIAEERHGAWGSHVCGAKCKCARMLQITLCTRQLLAIAAI